MINAYYDGIYSNIEDVKIGLHDRSVYFGDAIYEVVLGGNRCCYQLERHLDRLYKNLDKIGVNHPNGMKEIIDRLIESSNTMFFYLYIQVSRRGKERLHAPENYSDYVLLITLNEASPEEYKKGVNITSLKDKRYEYCSIKTTNLLPSVLASIFAQKNGCDEAVFIREGIVTECAKSNIFIIKNKNVYTHPLCDHILDGITRENVLSLSSYLGLSVKEAPFSYDEMLAADEVFITSTTKLARRVLQIDKTKLKCSDPSTLCAIQAKLYSDFLVQINL